MAIKIAVAASRDMTPAPAAEGDALPSDPLIRHALALHGLQDEALAKDADVTATQALASLQFDPQNGLQAKTGRDAVEALPGALRQAEAIRQQARAGLPNAKAQAMFDAVFTRRLRYGADSMASYAAGENRRWMARTGETRIANEIATAALYWNDDRRFAQGLGTIESEVVQRGEMTGAPPEQLRADAAHYASLAWVARIRAALAHDPQAARQLFAANAQNIDPPHRAQLAAQLARRHDAALRDGVARARADEQGAPRALRIAHDETTADHIEAASHGAAKLGAGDIADLTRTQRLGDAGGAAVLAAQRQATQGAPPHAEDAAALVDLWRRRHAGEDVGEDAAAALGSGKLAAASAGGLLRGNAAIERNGRAPLERRAFAQLKAVLDGHAVEQGTKDPDLAPAATALWGAAQGEWSKRAIAGTEDPHDVLADMVQRYARPPQVPARWPTPMFGPVGSMADLAKVWGRTRAAAASGRINPQKLRSEAQLLGRYRGLFEGEARQDAAIAAVRLPSPSVASRRRTTSTPTGRETLE